MFTPRPVTIAVASAVLAAGCEPTSRPAAGPDAGEVAGESTSPGADTGGEMHLDDFQDDEVDASGGETGEFADPRPLDLAAAEAEDPGTEAFVDTAGPGQHTVVIEGMDFSRSEYRITATGSITGRALESADTVEGRAATGSVRIASAQDVLLIEGEIDELEVPGTARVYVDGEIVQGGPRTRSSNGSFGTRTIAITIHTSVELLRRHGRAGERSVARFAARAFEEAGRDYDIVTNLAPKAAPNERAVCGADNVFGWWRTQLNQNLVDVKRKDSNVLLVDARGGGCGSVGGYVATTPGRNIDGVRSWRAVGSGRWHGNVHANLHEIGHNLGSSHRGDNHMGEGWNEDRWFFGGTWHRTPNVGSNGTTNACGFGIEEREFEHATLHQTYSPCAVERFRIQ